MSERTVPWDAHEKCDVCGVLGAWDFMGNFICQTCLTTAEMRMPYEDNPAGAEESAGPAGNNGQLSTH